MKPFEPSRLRADLPPWGQDGPPAAELAAYLDFYQLNDRAKDSGGTHRVGWRCNLRVLERLFSPEVLRLPSARHHLVNEALAVREAMWRWLDERCAWGAPEARRERCNSFASRPRD